MKKEMLINVLQPEECRIAIVEDGVLEELYVERTSQESYVGNIYKGRIVNIEPSIQAAFVDFGIGRNGFLHVSDVEPTYYRHLEGYRGEEGGPGPEAAAPPEAERPRSRDSAEQRTAEGDPPAQPFDDAELFFPRSGAGPAPGPEHVEPESAQFEAREYEPGPEASEHEE